jgi:hypothetical protein
VTMHTIGPWYVVMVPGPLIHGPKGEQIADLRGAAALNRGLVESVDSKGRWEEAS